MSDNEHSDGLEDLQDLMEEYKAKENSFEENNVQNASSVEVPMEKIIFGDKSRLLKNMAKAVDEKLSNEDAEVTDSHEKRKAEKRKPAWADADDEEIEVGDVPFKPFVGKRDHIKEDKAYKEHLAKRFERIMGAQPKWAKFESKQRLDVDSDDEELLRTVGFLEKPTGSVLMPNNLDFKHMRSLNRSENNMEGPIVSIQFHPTSSAALVAGQSGFATIYAVDGRKNEKLHSIRFKDFPLKCVRIMPCGTKAIFGSHKPYYYSYDLMTAQETRFYLPREVGPLSQFSLSSCGRYMAMAGRGGELHLFDANANELIYTFKQENTVAGIHFTGDSQRIICNSEGPNASIFSMRMRRIEHNFLDEGCVRGSCIDLSANQRLLATASMEGVVNVYDFEHVQTTKTPTPIKTFLNLTTAISDVKFNHSSEMLAMCSGEVNDAIRLAHFPSATVYSNFPERFPNLGPIRTVEFSPSSGYFALGSRNKTANLYRLKHFNNY